MTNLLQAAAYYDVSGEALDLIPTVSYAAGVPTCLIATYLIESRGLRTGVKIGAYLTGVGGLLCCLSTFPGLNQHISKEYQYWMAVIGQGITGVAFPFISGVPTKIYQHWFPGQAEDHGHQSPGHELSSGDSPWSGGDPSPCPATFRHSLHEHWVLRSRLDRSHPWDHPGQEQLATHPSQCQ